MPNVVNTTVPQIKNTINMFTTQTLINCNFTYSKYHKFYVAIHWGRTWDSFQCIWFTGDEVPTNFL